jgi:hypothetical protein
VYVGSNPTLPTLFAVAFCKGRSSFKLITSGSSSFGRAIAFQAIGGQFEPGLPLIFLPATAEDLSRGSSGVEHFLGREGVVSSILTYGSIKILQYNLSQWFTDFKRQPYFSKQILKYKQWQKNHLKEINPI